MNQVFHTISESILVIIGRSVELFPSFVAAIILIFATRYAINPLTRVARLGARKLTHKDSLEILIVQVVSFVAWFVSISLACTLIFPSLRLGDIIGFLGLSSVAVGFAFQDIFKNFLAGILLLINEPFKINDQIIINDYEGTVESITLRATQIRTYQDEQVVIPNALVFTSPVRVLTHYQARRTDLTIGLDYSTPLLEARKILLAALEGIDDVLSQPSPEVDLVGFGDSSIDLVVRYWTFPRKATVRRTQSLVVIALKQACDKAGFNIPFPIQTLYLPDEYLNK